MKWEGQEESENVEDRRGLGKKGLVIGGGGALLILLVGALLGVDPKELNKRIGNAQNNPGGGQNNQVERPLTPEEQRSRKFAATILRFTEEVWDEQFRKAGKSYQKPHMVLFAEQVDTGCGTAPS